MKMETSSKINKRFEFLIKNHAQKCRPRSLVINFSLFIFTKRTRRAHFCHRPPEFTKRLEEGECFAPFETKALAWTTGWGHANENPKYVANLWFSRSQNASLWPNYAKRRPLCVRKHTGLPRSLNYLCDPQNG